MLAKFMANLAKKRKGGFTLIELIVVIAILAILAAILIPVVSGYISDSKESVGNSNAQSVFSTAQAAAAYVSGNGEAVASIDITDVAGATDTEFEKQIAKNLGTTFEGYFTVTVDANGTVTGATWSENSDGSDGFTFPESST